MVLLAPLDFYIIILSNLLTMSVSNVGLFQKLAERTKIRYLRIYFYVLFVNIMVYKLQLMRILTKMIP